jgi:hypothetical protein
MYRLYIVMTTEIYKQETELFNPGNIMVYQKCSKNKYQTLIFLFVLTTVKILHSILTLF